MTILEWQKYEAQRQRRITENRVRRMQRNPQPPLPTIPRLPKPTRVQLYTPDGDYIGTWPYGVSKEDALAEAWEQGYKVGKVKEENS